MPQRYILAILLILLTPFAAHAQNEAVRQAERLRRVAIKDYDTLEFDGARQALLSAIAKLREAGLDNSPVAAKCHIDLGIVYIAGFKDRQRGIQQFVNALQINPQAVLDPERATPELQEAFDTAAKQAARSAKSEPAAPIEHEPVDEAKPGQPITVKARLNETVSAPRMFIFYRSVGSPDFVALPMERSAQSGIWSAEIPADAVIGRTLQYYIEARDAKGRPVVAAGSAGSPYIISVTGAPSALPPPKTAASPPQQRAAPSPPKPWDAQLPPHGFRRLYVDAVLGTGIGAQRAGNVTEVAYENQSGPILPVPVRVAGAASAPFHIAVGFGVRVHPNITLGLIGRFQLATASNAASASSPARRSAVAGLFRFRYQFREPKARLRPWLHANVGYGFIRHTLDVTSANTDGFELVDANGRGPVCPTGNVACIDTIRVGSVLVGAGGGLWYGLKSFSGGTLGLVFDFSPLVGLGVRRGENRAAVNFDLQLGLSVEFL